MKPGFVGNQVISSPEKLESLIQTHAGNQGWYFLRWPHGVSGFQSSLPPNFERAEGQMFTPDRELRWKPQGNGQFNVLLLCLTDIPSFEHRIESFDLIPGDWIAQDRDAHVYPPTETRLPKGIIHNNVDIGQRYFIDQTTWTVHFVALVAKETK